MSIQAVAWAISQRVGSPTGKVLLICLANYADDKGLCWPSQKTISKETELSERSTTIWLQKLEASGYISRERRHRSDGSRTSDFITLTLDRQQHDNEISLTADSAVRSSPSAPPAKPNRISAQSKPQEVHPIEPSPKPSKEPSSGARARGTDGFEKLWEDWPAKERPDKIEAARWAFDRLSTAEQSLAVQQAWRFRRLAKARKDMALMIPYLKQRQFTDLASGPEINADGKFIITPERPEWSAWLEHMRSKYSDKTVQRVEVKKYFYADHRWPTKIEPTSEAQVK